MAVISYIPNKFYNVCVLWPERSLGHERQCGTISSRIFNYLCTHVYLHKKNNTSTDFVLSPDHIPQIPNIPILS